jgi:hypothetical protein
MKKRPIINAPIVFLILFYEDSNNQALSQITALLPKRHFNNDCDVK